MKHLKFLKMTIFIALMGMIISCTPEDSMNMNTAAAIKQIETTVKTGNWRITSYIDSGKNETGDYTGYNFTFGDNGLLIASNGSNTINGSWSVKEDSSNSSSSSSNDGDVDFNIAFSSPEDFEELTDDWDIVSTNNSKINLIDVSGGNGGTDTLVFERN